MSFQIKHRFLISIPVKWAAESLEKNIIFRVLSRFNGLDSTMVTFFELWYLRFSLEMGSHRNMDRQ